MKKQILLIDRDAAGSAFGDELVKAGYEVCPAATVSAALEGLRRTHPHVVLLDADLDAQEESSLLQEIRSQEGNPPVIMMSRRGPQEGTLPILRLSAREMLFKPIDAREIVRKVQDVLRAEQDRERIESARDFEARLKSLQRLAGGVANDLRNHLTVILNCAYEALEDAPEDSKTRESLNWILYSANAVHHLSGKMLAFSGGGHFELEHLDLCTFLPEILDDLRRHIPQVAAGRINVTADIRLKDAFVEGDRKELHQALHNLVLNAVEASDAAKRNVVVTLSRVPLSRESGRFMEAAGELKPGEYYCVRIEDAGHGMSEETLRNIFDPFFNVGKLPGRGMGLPAALGILRGHGGDIRVESELGRGTRVALLLPVAETVESRDGKPVADRADWAESPDPTRAADAALRKAPPSVGKKTVLVIDDEDAVRKLTITSLDRSGYSTLSASNGREGIALFESRREEIDLVVLDMSLPDMGGDEVLDRIRAIQGDAKVLVVSGYHPDDKGYQYGLHHPDSFLLKPFRIPQLRQKIRDLIS